MTLFEMFKEIMNDNHLDEIRGGYYYMNGGNIDPVYVYGSAGGGNEWNNQWGGWNEHHEGNYENEYNGNGGGGNNNGENSNIPNNKPQNCIYIPNRPKSIDRQVGNFCVFFVMEKILKILNNNSIKFGNDVNSLLNAYIKQFGAPLDGVYEENIKDFVENYLNIRNIENSIKCKEALAKEQYVVATLNMGGEGDGHFVLITGYCDGNYVFLDPLTGNEQQANEELFIWTLSYEVLSLKNGFTSSNGCNNYNYYKG